MEANRIDYAIVPSHLGLLLVAATRRGVCLVRFGEKDVDLEKALRGEFPFAALRRDEARLRPWSDALLRGVEGGADPIRIPLDVRGSQFQRRVWSALQEIPRGQTRSYSAVAQSLGRPTAVRAVARACATNPVPVIVPCHRVVPKSGGIGRYAGGAQRKSALLEREGALEDGLPGGEERLAG